jgi:hypothetical protein
MRSLKHLESDEIIINKWGYAMFAGVIGMAAAYDSGLFSPLLGFALGFVSVFFGLIGLELWGQRIQRKRQLNLNSQDIPT